ncbi:MAG: hypothetical protein IPF99_06660 [Deltaproteobacteria bacterium]|nr:hypothetical protein [Deltaproteobacteria bacterium]
MLDEVEAETTLRVARAWTLRPSDVLGIGLGNVFLIAGLRAGDDAGLLLRTVLAGMEMPTTR